MSLKRKEATFSCGDETCAAWFYPASADKGARSIIVMAQGLTGTRRDRLGAFASRFAAAGIAALVFDYRDFGDSTGEPDLFEPAHQLDDWRAAIAFARSLPDIDAARVATFGSWLGGGNAPRNYVGTSSMDDWHPEALAKIADRLGIAFADLAPPCARTFSTPGGPSIHVLDWGGENPAAVLLHGGSLTARTWDYVAIALRSDFRLIAIDLRGHGASDWANDYSIESCTTDVLAVIDGLRIERTRLVGMSFGGAVACEFALRHPERTESLTMVDVSSRPVFAATARMRSFMTEFPGAATVDEVVEMALAVSPRSDPDRLRYRMRTLLKRGNDGRLVWKSDRRRPADYPTILRHLAGFETRVADIAAPFLLARGGESLITSEAAARDFTARFPDGRWINIEGAGHNVQEDNPRDLADALRTFWGTGSGTTSPETLAE